MGFQARIGVVALTALALLAIFLGVGRACNYGCTMYQYEQQSSSSVQSEYGLFDADIGWTSYGSVGGSLQSSGTTMQRNCDSCAYMGCYCPGLFPSDGDGCGNPKPWRTVTHYICAQES
jgi:hypothetical protein